MNFQPLLLLAFASTAVMAAEFPEPYDSEKSPDKPLSAAETAAGVEAPDGFRVTVFAAEPDVRQPIAMATDTRGRLWVAENYTYSESSVGYHPELRDRIVIFEDTDNDGIFDERKVFWNGARRLTSIEIGNGGVWAICLPELVFIPDENGDDVPDGEPVVLLDGFDFQRARHTAANGLRWGPDGWLYGRQGIQAKSKVGAPGSPDEKRAEFDAGIWRFHPGLKRFEVVARGTTNPWGMDWDAHGEALFINTVIGHLWHVVPGAYYRRMFGDHTDPHVYEVLEQAADHVHWATGEDWTDIRKGSSKGTSAAGGGHAHTGLLIYQGGQWPQEWAGKLLTINFHGRRFNVEKLEQAGSGIVARHQPDAFQFPDPWFRGIDLIAAPDGGVFVSDWSDTGECHDHDGVHRNSGRIYKISHGESKPLPHRDIAALTQAELAELQLSDNDWEARQARRVLANLAAEGESLADAHAPLALIFNESENEIHRLRALWALHVSGGEPPLEVFLADHHEHVRAWALRLLRDGEPENLARLAEEILVKQALVEESPRVRLALATLLPKLPPQPRRQLAAALLTRSQDRDDPNIPLLLWYGSKTLADVPREDFAKLAAEAEIPRFQKLAARRLAEEIDEKPEQINALLTTALTAPKADLGAILDGIGQGLSGRRKAPQPASWPQVRERLEKHPEESVRERFRDLSALFGDGLALDQIRAVALDEQADIPQRRAALGSLVEARAPDLAEVSAKLLNVRDLTATAAAGLAMTDDPGVPERLLEVWPKLYGYERAPVMEVFVSRPAWAAKVLDAIEKGRLARHDLSAFHARQIRSHGDPALDARLTEVWGEVEMPARGEDKAALLEKWTKELSPEALAAANPAKGREIYQAVCSACHKMNGQGGDIGPDLTGSNRDNLDYLLENTLFPNEVVADAYRQSTITLKDGRVLSGVISGRGTRTLTLQTMGQRQTIELTEVEKEETSENSLMPEGLLDAIGPEQSRHLIRFLMEKD